MSQFGGKNSKRNFRVVMGNKEHGLYVSSTPSSAAKKAVTKLCAANKSKKVKFHIREITQGSKKKTYGPYSGFIEKLKEPIELKGRVIKYKPGAKLSDKLGAKKGGMKGGKELFNDFSYPPYFEIKTDADLRRPKGQLSTESFNTTKLLYDFNQPSNSNSNLLDKELRLPKESADRKIIRFKFRNDISDKLIEAFLSSKERKQKIFRMLEKLEIPNDVKIYLYIPYKKNNDEPEKVYENENKNNKLVYKIDDNTKIEYEKHLFIFYTPDPALLERRLPFSPENVKDYSLLDLMTKSGKSKLLSKIITVSEFDNFCRDEDIEGNEKNKLRKDYEWFIKKPLIHNT